MRRYVPTDLDVFCLLEASDDCMHTINPAWTGLAALHVISSLFCCKPCTKVIFYIYSVAELDLDFSFSFCTKLDLDSPLPAKVRTMLVEKSVTSSHRFRLCINNTLSLNTYNKGTNQSHKRAKRIIVILAYFIRSLQYIKSKAYAEHHVQFVGQ